MPSTDMTPQVRPELRPWYAPYTIMPRFFRDAVECGVRMKEAVRKMTSLPAQSWGLYDRGILRPAMKADIVVSNPAEYRPMADVWHPTARAEGVSYVMVNGKLILDNGELTKEKPGEILSRMR